MSHSSGIPVSAALSEAFAAAQGSSTRLIKVEIQDDELKAVHQAEGKGAWHDDLAMVSPLCEKDVPCYILFQKQTDSGSNTWVMFTYVPDTAKVKPKMLYASTRAPLKMQLGSNNFENDIYGTEPDDFTPAGYDHFIESQKAEAPLTDAEFSHQQEIESGEIHMGTGTTHVHGVAFPVDDAVLAACANLNNDNYVCISIDTKAERITLDHAGKVSSVEDLKGKINKKEPRFHVWAWTHQFKGESITSNVFAYSCPDGSAGTKACPVKQRMLYSSSKANVQSIMEKAGGSVDGKIEVNSADELTDESVFQSVHPPEKEVDRGFAKPKRAGRTGGRRLIRDRP